MNSPRRDRFFRKDRINLYTIILVLIMPFLSLRAIDPRSPATARNRHLAEATDQPGQKIFHPPRPADVSMPHVLAASFYSLREHRKASLILSDQGPRQFQIQATLFNIAGERFDVPPITLEGNKIRTFDLAAWVSLADPTFQEGSLQVHYDGKEMELGGVVKLVDADHSLIFDEELSEPMMFASSRLEGVWWLPSAKTEISVVVSNTTDAAVNAFVTIDGIAPSRNETQTIELGGHQTKVVDLRELTEEKAGSLLKVGGISIQHSGPKGGVLARGLIQDVSTGYSNVLEFTDPQTTKSPTLDGAGLRVAPIGNEELTQIVVARNVSNSKTTLTGRVSISQSDGQTSIVSLHAIPLAPGQTTNINLNGAINKELTRHAVAAGLHFEYSSAPGTVVMAAQSVSENENHVFRVPMVDSGSISSSTGQYPWAVDGSSSSFVYLKNATDKPQQYHLEIDFDNGVYSLGMKTIEPDQPIAFDLRALRDKQVPDVKGRKIPLKAASGQVHWSIDGDEHVGLIGRVEQVDLVKGISMTAACTECCPDSWYSFWIDPLGGTALPGDTSQFAAMQQNITCYGEILDPFQRFPDNFTSDDPSVANCDSSGFTTAFTPGTANLGAHWTVVSWDFDPIGSGGCTRYLENANPEGVCDVAGIRGYVTNPPIDNDGDAIIAGQQFTLTAEIVKPNGDRATSFSGDSTFSMAAGSITGENLPTGISISNGIGTVQMTLKAVKNTGEAGRSYHLTFTDGATGTTDFGGFFNIYFGVEMDVERWKNCDFVSCPNLGSYFCTRGCNPFSGFESPTSFISLTDSSACGAGVRVVNSETGAFGGTNVSDLGPTTNNKYWLTGNMPSMGGCLSDNLANLIGVDNGCNPNHGEGLVYWRFIPN